jgi:hypothetical protein
MAVIAASSIKVFAVFMESSTPFKLSLYVGAMMSEESSDPVSTPSPVREDQSYDMDTPAGRALAEAAERRAQAEAKLALAHEINGPKGAEPTRFGDWERKGIAYDF